MARTRIRSSRALSAGSLCRLGLRPSGHQFDHIAAHLSFYDLTNTQYEEIQGVVMPGRSVLLG